MTASAKTRSLFRQRSFMLLWSGQTISLFGTQLTAIALPITAVVVLDVSPFEAGLLRALETLPFLFFGLAVGVLLDRRARRPFLLVANIVAAAALSSVPVAYLMGRLTILQLFVVVFIVGTATVFFDIGYQSYLPNLMGRDRLMEANAKMQVSESTTDVVSPGLAGVLISAITAPYVLVIDVVSYLVSVVTIFGLPADSRPAAASGPDGQVAASVWASMQEGIRLVGRHPLLRWCTTAAVVTNFCVSGLMAVFFLFLIRAAGMGPAQVGLVLSVGSAGAVAGGLVVDRLTHRFGVGPMLVQSTALPGLGYLMLAAVHGHSVWAVGTAAVADFVAMFALPLFNVTVITLRQVATPDHLLGRANATVRTFAWGAVSLGALLGGVLGSTLGLRATIVIAAATVFAASATLFFSPVRRARQLDGMEPGEAAPNTAPLPT